MITDILQQMPLLKDVDNKSLSELIVKPHSKLSTYKDKEFIALQGDLCKSVYILYKGKISAQMENINGKVVTIEILSAPEILAPAFIYASENRFPVNIVACDDCEILIINKEYFLDFMQKNPSVMRYFIQDISDRSMFLSKKVNEFALQNLRSRIIGYINKYGPIKNQQALALRLAVARPSLAKVITEMIEDGTLERIDKIINLKS